MVSASVDEVQIAERWLMARLLRSGGAGDLVGGRVWVHETPPQAELPVIVVTLASDPVDRRINGPYRSFAECTYIVRWIGEGGDTEPGSVCARRLDDDLHAQFGAVAGGEVVSCHRVGPYRRVYRDGEVRINEIGAIYTIRAKIIP